MPLPPTIIEHPSAHWSSREGLPILAIVAHGTVGTNSLAYLTKNPRQVSIPYLIARDGTLYHMVDDSKAANHAGAPSSTLVLGTDVYRGGRVNMVTTGFELESLQRGTPEDYTADQLLAMGWLVNDMRRRHGAIPIVRHAALDPTRRSDPVGLSVADMERYAQRAAAIAPPADDWSQRWGPIATPDQTSWLWDIPMTWQKHWQRLGKCIGSALYDHSNGLVIQCFEGGDVRQKVGRGVEVCFRV